MQNRPVLVSFLLTLFTLNTFLACEMDSIDETQHNEASIQNLTANVSSHYQQYDDTFQLNWPVHADDLTSIGNGFGQIWKKFPPLHPTDPKKQYLHPGVDFMAVEGTSIYTPIAGHVISASNREDGHVHLVDHQKREWRFWHLKENSVPENVMNALSSGAPISAGTIVGQIMEFTTNSQSNWVRFDHLHLDVLDATDENNKIFLNVLNFLKPMNDSGAPEIANLEVDDKNHGTHPETGHKYVYGNYQLVAIATDYIRNNEYQLAAHKLQYSVDGGELLDVWTFDTLPGGSDYGAFTTSLYSVLRSTSGYGEIRRPAIKLGFHKEGQVQFPQEEGEHVITIVATDIYGNENRETFAYTVTPLKALFSVQRDGLDFNFQDTSFVYSGYPTNEITSWLWNFGDGETSNEANPSHQYAANGQYSVSLTVTDTSGNSDTFESTVSFTCQNIALTATAHAQGEYSEYYKKENAVDGNDQTVWGSSGPSTSQWFYVSLSSATQIDHVTASFLDPYLPEMVKLFGRTGEQEWQLITQNSLSSTIFDQDVRAPYDQIGFILESTEPGYFGVSEFQVYGYCEQ